MRKYFYSLFFLLSFFISQGQINPLVTEDALAQQQWVDSTYTRMTLKEKVGQSVSYTHLTLPTKA